ncbi:hypothetical protein [Halomarina oriensis]|uniref:Uncharacterized protein n=1 Tax=Halomarina oriensis TaxID=671145 RepID=A0A6B0GJA4_9EURY|nr:hypothetical protein [Halomarina oriensis]MWG34670.1 hypothetical protein [Halomarina oriensis]
MRQGGCAALRVGNSAHDAACSPSGSHRSGRATDARRVDSGASMLKGLTDGTLALLGQYGYLVLFPFVVLEFALARAESSPLPVALAVVAVAGGVVVWKTREMRLAQFRNERTRSRSFPGRPSAPNVTPRTTKTT